MKKAKDEDYIIQNTKDKEHKRRCSKLNQFKGPCKQIEDDDCIFKSQVFIKGEYIEGLIHTCDMNSFQHIWFHKCNEVDQV